MIVLIKTLDEPIPRSEWTKVLAQEGEIRKESEILFFVGEKTVEIINYILE